MQCNESKCKRTRTSNLQAIEPHLSTQPNSELLRRVV
jgi:hypothetical protein